MAPAVDRQVDTIGLLKEAALEIYSKRAVLATALLLPVLISIGIRIVCWQNVCVPEQQNPKAGTVLLMMVANVPFYVIIATICHRVVLLGAASLPNKWGLFWSTREMRFLGWLAVLSLIGFLLSAPGYLLPTLVMFFRPDWSFGWYSISTAMYLSLFISVYIDGRFGLVLPATAVGHRLNLIRSWRFTAGNGWSICLALFAPILLIRFIEFALSYVLPDSGLVIATVVGDLLVYPLIAMGIVILTIAYRDLVIVPGDAAPPDGS